MVAILAPRDFAGQHTAASWWAAWLSTPPHYTRYPPPQGVLGVPGRPSACLLIKGFMYCNCHVTLLLFCLNLTILKRKGSDAEVPILFSEHAFMLFLSELTVDHVGGQRGNQDDHVEGQSGNQYSPIY